MAWVTWVVSIYFALIVGLYGMFRRNERKAVSERHIWIYAFCAASGIFVVRATLFPSSLGGLL